MMTPVSSIIGLCVGAVLALAGASPLPQEKGATPDQKFGKSETHQQGQSDGSADRKAWRDSDIVRVTISTSRPEITTSENFGIYADFQNLQPTPVVLRASETTLVIEPEILKNQDCVIEVTGFFPTEGSSNSSRNPPAQARTEQLGGDAAADPTIIIQPREHYTVFWDPNSVKNVCSDAAQSRFSWIRSSWSSAGRAIGFVPGDYAFVVLGKAHIVDADGKVEDDYHTFTQAKSLHVSITQWQSIIAAMLGGLLAYFVAALRPGGELRALKRETEDKKRSLWSKWGVILRSLISAALLSAALTVVLSRISDTQFPIKVSVSDFWGALTIGFISYFSGNKLIEKIADSASRAKHTG